MPKVNNFGWVAKCKGVDTDIDVLSFRAAYVCQKFFKPTDRRRAFRVCIAWLFDLYLTTPFLNLAKRNTYSHS